MIFRLVVTLFFSLVISFLLPDVMAQVPTFDQSTYVYEHNGILTIDDSNASSNPINATITSNGDVEVFLYQIGNSSIYKSNLIYFSQTESNRDGEFPVVNVSENSIDARYNGNSASAPIEETSTSLIRNDDYFTPPDTFDIQNYPNCNNFGNDTDGDYICNDWETGNNLVNLNNYNSNYTLPLCDPLIDYSIDKLGVEVCPNPDVKDIYIEIDYMKNHKPNVEALEKVVEAFRNAPVENASSDYPTGINLHIFIDYEIKHVNQLHFDETVEGGFHDIKARDYGLSNAITPPEQVNGNWTNPDNKMAKAQIFYYYIWAHEQAIDSDSSGISEQNGNDGSVTLGKFVGMVGNSDQQAGTFMHELGHNIGLNHGGGQFNVDNCKPNLLSVMTYSRQFSDLLERPLDYSRQTVGNTSDIQSLGWEDRLNNADGISGYPNCPFVSSTDQNDLDFDGVADVCDEDTIIFTDTIVMQNVSLFGNLTIKPDAVLTINPGIALDFDAENQKILVESEGGLLVKSGAKINGYSGDNLDGYHENSPIVFGDRGTIRVENSHQDEIIWPDIWQDIRFIKDDEGNYVCPWPDGVRNEGQLVPVDLVSFDQWSLVNLSRANEQWQGGRHGTIPSIIPTSLDSSPGIIKFTSAALPNLRTQLDAPSENVTISIKSGSGIAERHDANLTCDDCFSPSYVKIDVGTKVTWINEDRTASHSITSAFWDKTDPKPKFDYLGEFNNHVFMKDQTFEHTFENIGTYQYGCIYHPWMKGIICVGPECSFSGEIEGGTSNSGEGEDEPRFDKKGKWCISRENAEEQVKNNPKLDINRAPLCSNPELSEEKELTIENVRAARSVNLDRVLVMIAKLNPTTDFEKPTDKAKLIQELQDIRQYVLKDKMPEALEGYINFADSVNVMVTSETSKYQILEVVDRNIETTTRAIPEFETVSILVLIISTITIIVLSRKISFNSINTKSI